MTYIVGIIIGLVAGVMGGLVGIGGGIIMIPALVIFLKFSQKSAQGTTLAAMIPPIGIMAALEYYKNGYVNVVIALCIAAGFLVGGYFGAKFAVHINEIYLKKFFAIFLFIYAIKLFFEK